MVADNAGNTATATWSFTVTDVEAPVISVLYPVDGALIVNPKPEITASFYDSGTAVNPSSAQILLDGVDVTANATVTTEGLAFTPLTDLALGAHTLEVHVADTAGNQATATRSFEIVAPILAYWKEDVLEVSVHGQIPPGSEVAEIHAEVTQVDFGDPSSIEVRTTTDLATGSFSILFRRIGPCWTFTANFSFVDAASVTGLPTIQEFTFEDREMGGDPTGTPPAPPTVLGIEVVGGLTGDEKDDSVSPKLRFTKEKNVSVQVEVRAAPGTSIQSVNVTATGPSTISGNGAGGGFTTVNLGELPEGEYLLSAMAVAVKGALTSAASLDANKELALQADFNKPELVYTFPPRRSYTDDKDIIFLNGNSAGDNETFRQHNNNFYAPGELLGHAEVVEALSGLSKKVENDPQVTVVGPGGARNELTTTLTPATEEEPAKIDVAAVPNDLPESVTMNGIAIASYSGRAGYHVKLTDRCGNELDTEQLSESNVEESALLERNAFRMWVDRTPPDAENGQNDWNQYKVLAIGKTDSVFMGPKAYYAVSSFDAAEGWQDSESLSNWLVKAYRTPAMLPKAEEFEIASQEFSPWLLKNPVSMPKPGPSAVPGKVKVRMRDLAGNISDWIELTGWELPEFDRAEGWADPKPQKLENGRTFTPAIMTIPPSFEDAPREQDFSMHHIDVDELDDENEDGYVDVLNEPGATLQEPSDPAVGVAPTEYVYTDQHNGPYGYTDLYNAASYSPSEGFLSGTISGTDTSIGGMLTWREPDWGWDFREGDAGWTRAVNRYIHTGYHWTNAVKMRPDVVATGTVVTLRVSGGFVDPANPTASGLIQTVAVGGSQATVLALPDPDKWDYVKFNGGALNGDPNETNPAIRAQKITILKDEQGNLRQRLLWGEKDGGNGTVVQTLEMDVEVGSQVPVGVFDVNVSLGMVVHILSSSFEVVAIELVGADAEYYDAPIPTDLALASDPSPGVEINQASIDSIRIENEKIKMTLSGIIKDDLADNAPGESAAQPSVQVLLNGSELTTVPVSRSSDTLTYWRQHACIGTFTTGEISFPMPRSTVTTITVRTAPNDIGNRGEASLRIEVGWAKIPGVTGLAIGPQDVTITHNLSYVGDLASAQEVSYIRSYPGVSETMKLHRIEGQIPRFSTSVAGKDVSLSVVSSSDNQVDVLIDIPILDTPVLPVRAILHRVSGPDSTFEGATLHQGYVTADSSEFLVPALEGSYLCAQASRRRFAPFTIRVKTASESLRRDITLNDISYKLEKKPDGYFYPVGPSKRIFVVIKRDGKWYLVSYDKDGYKDIDELKDLGQHSLAEVKSRFGVLLKTGEISEIHELKYPSKLWQYLSNEAKSILIDIQTTKLACDEIRKWAHGNWMTGSKPQFDSDAAMLQGYLQSGLPIHPVTGKPMPSALFTGIPGLAQKLQGLPARKLLCISAKDLYDLFSESLPDTTEYLQCIWILDNWQFLNSIALWAKVPLEVTVAGLYAEMEDDSLLSILAETDILNNHIVSNYRIVTGSGIANLHWSLPREYVHGIPISVVLARPGNPLGESISQKWARAQSDPVYGRLDRDYYRDKIQQDPKRSLVIYAALWRAIAEEVRRQAPSRLPSVPSGENVNAWTTRTIDVGSSKVSIANLVMMVIEQAYLGQMDNGELVDAAYQFP